MELEWIKKN